MSQQLGLSSAGCVSVPGYTGWTHSYLPSADGLIHMSGSWLALGRDNWVVSHFNSVQFSSVPQSCPTLCDPMDCSMPGFPVHHQLPELTQTHVMPPNHLIICRPLLQPSIFPSIRVFSVSQFFTSGDQSIVVSASASSSVLSMNSQDWFPLGLTGWISLQSKGLSRVFSSTTVWKHQRGGSKL